MDAYYFKLFQTRLWSAEWSQELFLMSRAIVQNYQSTWLYFVHFYMANLIQNISAQLREILIFNLFFFHSWSTSYLLETHQTELTKCPSFNFHEFSSYLQFSQVPISYVETNLSSHFLPVKFPFPVDCFLKIQCPWTSEKFSLISNYLPPAI